MHLLLETRDDLLLGVVGAAADALSALHHEHDEQRALMIVEHRAVDDGAREPPLNTRTVPLLNRIIATDDDIKYGNAVADSASSN